MAIRFARLAYVKRSEGKSAIAAAAYQSRSLLVDPRTGEQHDYRDQGPLEAPTVFLLPAGADPAFADAQTLSAAAELSETRKNSQVAKLLLLGLPKEVSTAQRIELATAFIDHHFVSKGVAAQLDFHAPHDGGDNYHCHVFITTRRIEGAQFARHKARDLDAMVRVTFGGHAKVVDANLWGELWGDHQQAYFAAQKLDIIVDPVAVYTSKTSYGPRRSWRDDRPAQQIADLKALNAKAAHDPALVLSHLQKTQQRFDGRALDRFLQKHIAGPAEQLEIRNKVLGLNRGELEKMRFADRVPSGWRELTAHDVARELSPTYAALAKQSRRLSGKLTKASAMIDANEAHREDAERQIAARWAKLGVVRRSLHRLGVLRDIEPLRNIDIDQQEARRRQADWGANFWAIRRKEYLDKIGAIDRAFEAVRSQAEEELARRQQIARGARQTLDRAVHNVVYRNRGYKI